MLTSAMTRNQVISFVLSVAIGFFLLIAGWPPVTGMLAHWAPLWLVDGVAAFSFMAHFDSLQRGVLDLRDLAYFVSVIVFMLFTAHVVLENRRAA